MKIKYNQSELGRRNKIIQSQVIFGNFLDSEITNKLINLFDENNKENESIVKYIESERKRRGYNSSNIIIRSEVYGEKKYNRHQGINIQTHNLLVEILKDKNPLLHLTIHLIPTTLNPNMSGIFHIYKNIYEKRVSSRQRYKLYALISVSQPINKPESLEFSITNGYNTPSTVPNIKEYDSDLQKEMDVIITVLNRIFNQNNTEYYIKLPKDMYSIHQKTNIILDNIDKYSKYTIRKNKGTQMIPLNNTKDMINIGKRSKTIRSKIQYNMNRRKTHRKIK